MAVRTRATPSRVSAGAVEMSIDDEGLTSGPRDTRRIRIVSADDVPGTSSDDEDTHVAPRWTYDRDTVQRFLTEVEVERARLLEEIAAARERLRELEAGETSPRDAAAAELGEVVLVAREELVALEREHEEALRAIRDGASVEAERLIGDAHERALEIHARAGSLRAGDVQDER